MKKKLLYMALGLFSLISFGSCSLDEYDPSDGDASPENLSYATWKGLQSQVYSTLYHELYSTFDFLSVSEGGTDLWRNTSDHDYAPEMFYYKGLGAAQTQPKKAWQQAYSVIATCNSVINKAPADADGNNDDIKVLTAEAKVIRAFMHLTLTTYFGQIYLCTNNVGEPNNAPTRNSLQEIYNSITTDLKEAAADLGVEPYGGNYARVTKKTALGLLARAYAQGAAEGLEEDGVSYWQRAKEVAEDMITNASSYGMYLYDDVSDLWAQDENRNNKEALFIAAGLDANGTDAANASTYFNAQNHLYAYTRPDPGASCQSIYKVKKASNDYYGNWNESDDMAPTKHAIDVFGDWDKRYENSFLTAFGAFTVEGSGSNSFTSRRVKITSTICSNYGIDTKFVNKYIYPYVALAKKTGGAYDQPYVLGVYDKGGGTQTYTATKNPFVIDMPLAEDEDRIAIYLSKQDLTSEQKANRGYFCMNISDLFDTDGSYKKANDLSGFNGSVVFPALIKFNWLYDGVTRHEDYDSRNGDIAVMRAAEIYLIAAEANVMLGNSGAAKPYIEKLQSRACRTGYSVPTLGTVDEQYILDEYAREFVGEHMRWAVLKRHRASGLMKKALQLYNKTAAASFDESIHYNRPIPRDFLDKISNAEEFGDNGYGYTANKGY